MAYISAYSYDRSVEIAGAVDEWFQSLPTPKNENCKAVLGAQCKTVWKWRKASFTPGPEYMYKLWKLTGNPVFLLLPEEYEVFKSRKTYIPDDMPVSEPREVSVAKPQTKEIPELEADNETTESVMIQAMNLHLISQLSGLSSLGKMVSLVKKEKWKIPDSLKKKAANLALEIVAVYDLKMGDFDQIQIDADNDPDSIKEAKRLMNIIFPKND